MSKVVNTFGPHSQPMIKVKTEDEKPNIKSESFDGIPSGMHERLRNMQEHLHIRSGINYKLPHYIQKLLYLGLFHSHF